MARPADTSRGVDGVNSPTPGPGGKPAPVALGATPIRWVAEREIAREIAELWPTDLQSARGGVVRCRHMPQKRVITLILPARAMTFLRVVHEL